MEQTIDSFLPNMFHVELYSDSKMKRIKQEHILNKNIISSRLLSLYSYSFEHQNRAKIIHKHVFNRSADTTVVAAANEPIWNTNHQLFAFGNGTSISNRNNAMTVRKKGSTTI